LARGPAGHAGKIFRALLFDKFIFEKGFAGGGLWIGFGAFVLTVGSWIWLRLVCVVRSALRDDGGCDQVW
jgi:hypothetical protein